MAGKELIEDDAILHITADPVRPLVVDLVGVKYRINPPKMALALKLGNDASSGKAQKDPRGLFKTLDTWVNDAFGPEEAKAVRARMADPEDALDFNHLMMLMQKLIERVTGNPTSSS